MHRCDHDVDIGRGGTAMRQWMTTRAVRTDGLPGSSGRLAGRRFALAVVAAMAIAVVGASAGTASASAAPHRLWPVTRVLPRPGLSLAQAPGGLRAAVHRTLGAGARLGAGAFRQTMLTASDTGSRDQVGFSVAVSGSTAVVGAYGHNSFTGAAYVFVRSGTTWSEQAELTASDGVSSDYFGMGVAVSGSTVV